MRDISKGFFCDTKSNPAGILTQPKVHENFQNSLFWWKSATFLHEKVIFFKEFNLLDPYHESVSMERFYLQKFTQPNLMSQVQLRLTGIKLVIEIIQKSTFFIKNPFLTLAPKIV